MQAQITRTGDLRSHHLAEIVDRAFDGAVSGTRRASSYVRSLRGMSGQKYRAFVNGLVGAVPDARYLEVGAWMGSTLCAAVDANAVTATVIDNWSEFGGPVAEFLKNVGGADIGRAPISILNKDFRQVRWDAIGLHNVYLFDGPHSYQDQFDGLAFAGPALDDTFVFIVDDWNWPNVRAGTLEAIKANQLKQLYAIEVRSTLNDVHPGDQGMATDENSEWHNGYFIGVLQK